MTKGQAKEFKLLYSVLEVIAIEEGWKIALCVDWHTIAACHGWAMLDSMERQLAELTEEERDTVAVGEDRECHALVANNSLDNLDAFLNEVYFGEWDTEVFEYKD